MVASDPKRSERGFIGWPIAVEIVQIPPAQSSRALRARGNSSCVDGDPAVPVTVPSTARLEGKGWGVGVVGDLVKVAEKTG